MRKILIAIGIAVALFILGSSLYAQGQVSQKIDTISHDGATKIHQPDPPEEYLFDFDTEVSKVVQKLKRMNTMDDDSLSMILNEKIRKMEDVMVKIGMDVHEEIEILHTMDWEEIKERHKIVIIGREEESEDSCPKNKGNSP